MLSVNKSYKNRKVSLTIHSKCKCFDSTIQGAEDRRQKFHFCRLPFAVNVMLNLSNVSAFATLVNYFVMSLYSLILFSCFFSSFNVCGVPSNLEVLSKMGKYCCCFLL